VNDVATAAHNSSLFFTRPLKLSIAWHQTTFFINPVSIWQTILWSIQIPKIHFAKMDQTVNRQYVL